MRQTLRRLSMAVGAVGLAALTSCAPDPPAAVVGIVVDSCDPGNEYGSGIVIQAGLILTSAHVVAGAQGITVNRSGRALDATIVGFDPNMDLAYLRVDDARVATLPVDSSSIDNGGDGDDGDEGVAYVVRNGAVVAEPVRIRRRVTINTEDIYIKGATQRPGFELDAAIESGDSGGAVVVDGKVVGVIWARSNKYDNRAYAIDPVRAGDLINEQLRSGELGDDVDITRCH